jgi:hypothetical protein
VSEVMSEKQALYIHTQMINSSAYTLEFIRWCLLDFKLSEAPPNDSLKSNSEGHCLTRLQRLGEMSSREIS